MADRAGLPRKPVRIDEELLGALERALELLSEIRKLVRQPRHSIHEIGQIAEGLPSEIGVLVQQNHAGRIGTIEFASRIEVLRPRSEAPILTKLPRV